MTEYVYSAVHKIHYNTKNPVPLSEVIVALEALQGLLRDVPAVIEGITGADVLRSEFFIERIETGSLIEDVLVKLFFKDEADFEAFMGKIRENGVIRNTIVGVVIGGLVMYGAMSVLGASKASAPNITANNNTIINIGAGEVKMTPEQFQSIIENAVTDKKRNAQNAVKFLAPARQDAESSVSIGGAEVSGNVVITPAAIAEAPQRVDSIKNQKIEEVGAATVQIRASDLDSKKNGWAGKIEGRTNRVKIVLDPVIDESELFGKQSITADVTIIHTMKSGANELAPSTIVIRKIYN